MMMIMMMVVMMMMILILVLVVELMLLEAELMPKPEAELIPKLEAEVRLNANFRGCVVKAKTEDLGRGMSWIRGLRLWVMLEASD